VSVLVVTTAVGVLLAQPVAAATQNGYIYTTAGAGIYGYNGDGIPATTAEFQNPTGVVVDTHGNQLIADVLNNRVRVVAASASNPGYPLGGCSATCTWTEGDIYTIAGTGAGGYNGDGIPATAAQIDTPADVALDSAGNVLIADEANGVRVVAVSSSNPGYPLSGCASACTWTAGDIYTIAGTGALGYNGDGIPSTDAELKTPAGVAFDAPGNVLVSDHGNSRVRVVALSPSNPGYALSGCASACTWTAGDIYTIAGTGALGYNGDGIPATSAGSTSPKVWPLTEQGIS
jgi:hypothetical protein